MLHRTVEVVLLQIQWGRGCGVGSTYTVGRRNPMKNGDSEEQHIYHEQIEPHEEWRYTVDQHIYHGETEPHEEPFI